MLLTPKLLHQCNHNQTMKTKNPRLVFGDDEFTYFRLNLLETNNTKDKKKADDCLRYLMNYQSHQQEF